MREPPSVTEKLLLLVNSGYIVAASVIAVVSVVTEPRIYNLAFADVTPMPTLLVAAPIAIYVLPVSVRSPAKVAVAFAREAFALAKAAIAVLDPVFAAAYEAASAPPTFDAWSVHVLGILITPLLYN